MSENMTQQENEKNDNISLSNVGAPGTGSNGGGGPTSSDPPGSSPFDFPGMGGANHNPPEPTLDLLGQGVMNVSTSMASNPGGSMLISGPPAPNSIPSMGVGPSPTGLMGQPNQGTNQMNQNSGAKPPTTKSHLAEILGSHEMHQLQTMSRTLDNCPPNSLPQSRPNNPGMMGMRPDQMSGSMGNFNQMQPGGYPGHMGAFMGAPNMPPANFRYPANPRQPGDYRPNFDPSRPVGTVTPPGMPGAAVKGDDSGEKKSAKRQRRPSSRKSSRDGDETSSSENIQRKRKRNTKDEAGGTKSTRKRKTKGSLPAEGSLLLFSTAMLNEASAEVLKKKKNGTIVDFHQNSFGPPHQLRAKMAPTMATTRPTPSGTSMADLPGVRPNMTNGARQSPGVTPDGVMSPSHLQNVMSPHGGPSSRNPMSNIPGRVPTPLGPDGRALTPGSIGPGGGRVPTPGASMPVGGCGPLSPAHSQESSRIPTPNQAPSPATSGAPPCASPGAHSQLSQGEQEDQRLKSIKEKIKQNPSPNNMHPQFHGRSPSQGGTPSPVPASHMPQMGQNGQTPPGPHQMDQQQQPASQQQMVQQIMKQQQAQQQQRHFAMMAQRGYGPPRYPHAGMMHRGMMPYGPPRGGMPHNYPPGMDPRGGRGFPPGMHPAGMHPGMMHMMGGPGHGMPNAMMRPRFPEQMSHGGNAPQGMPPGSNYYSEQLRQKASLIQGGMPPNGPPGMNTSQQNMNGPTTAQPGFNPGQNPMMNNGPNFNNQNSNPPGQMGQSGPIPNGQMGRSGTPNSSQGGINPMNQAGICTSAPQGQQAGYPPAASPGANQQFNQNGPGLMSPMGNQQGAPPSQTAQNSSLVNLLHSNSNEQQSPYQAKSPASQLNGNIMSPTPSQPPGGPPSIAPSVPEFAPTTPSGAPPLSPAHTNPMTPNPTQAVGGNDSFGPMTPSGVAGNQGNPMTPLTNPMTPSNPLTPGPATPGGQPQQPPNQDPITNGLPDPNQPIVQSQGGSMSLPPCSPHTPQGSVGNPGGFQSRPDAPLTPSGTPNGMNPNGGMNSIRMNGDPLLPPADMDMNAFLQQPDPNKLNMQMQYNQRMPGQHMGGMNHSGIGPGMTPTHGYRMMHQPMGMPNPYMNHHPNHQQAAFWGPGQGAPR